MCVYCNTGDFFFKQTPPWNPPWPSPLIPQPVVPLPVKEWDLAPLRELLDLLERIKALEDKLGCPCEPNKADYIKVLSNRITELEKRIT